MLKKNISLISASLLLSASAYAGTVQIVGTLPITVPVHNSLEAAVNGGKAVGSYTVSLMKVKVSKEASERLAANIKEVLKNSRTNPYLGFSAIDNTVQKQLGMNGVAPLNQGVHGSCATFANTGAIDALYTLTNQSSQLSELCNLELGKTINNPNKDGGWNGSWGPYVLKQINDYGYMTIGQESSGICGGLTSYPVNSYGTGGSISVSDFKSKSTQNKFTKSNWSQILPTASNFPIDPTEANKVLAGVKKAINSGHRVSFGTLLDVNAGGQNGAVGKYKGVANDTWVLTSQIEKDAKSGSINAGHEMVITGYDDTACATYKDGWFGPDKKQCGILTLRNSWGNTGNNGDYYMTYDHFKTLVMEAQEIK